MKRRTLVVIIGCIFVVALTGRYSSAQTDRGIKGEQKGEMKQQGMMMDAGMMSMMKQMMCDSMMKDPTTTTDASQMELIGMLPITTRSMRLFGLCFNLYVL